MKVELDLTRREIIILTTMTNVDHNTFKNLLKEHPTVLECLDDADKDVPDNYTSDDNIDLYTKLKNILDCTKPIAPLEVYKFAYLNNLNQWVITDYYYTVNYAKKHFSYTTWEKIDSSLRKIYIDRCQTEFSAFTADYVNKNLA